MINVTELSTHHPPGHYRVVANSPRIIQNLVAEAREVYKSLDKGHIIVYTPNRSLRSWTRSSARPPRKLDSVILPRKVKEGIVEDVKDFFENEGWYVDRG